MHVTEATFQTDVLDRSHETPVVVDFWADWCGPCRALTPVLERLAAEADGSWALAKVNVDENPRLAAAAGVQGIPAVRAFKEGRQVAEFVGALPEQQVRAWLGQLGPSEADLAVAEGERAEASGDIAGAREAYRRALALEPTNEGARAGLARVELAARSGAADEAELARRLASDPSDVDAILETADLEMARGEADAAIRRLLDAVRATEGDARERVRARLVELLDTLPADDPRVPSARRSLSLALF